MRETRLPPGVGGLRMIVPGSASQGFAATLAAELDEPLAVVEYEEFADGEQLVRVPDADRQTPAPDRAIVVAATVSAETHIELLQLHDIVNQWVDEVITVLPYMGYARQDQAFRSGEPVSARAVARAVSTGTDQVVTINPHEPAVCGFFDVPCTAIDAAGQLAEPLPQLTDPLFLSPDAGAIDLAVTVRDAYGRGETDFFEKQRISDDEVEITPSDATTDARDIILVDDIVATGVTMSSAISQLTSPADIYVTCVHPLLVAGARTRLTTAGVEAIYGTDTVERAVTAVSAAPPVTSYL